jgi:hypothetical protein
MLKNRICRNQSGVLGAFDWDSNWLAYLATFWSLSFRLDRHGSTTLPYDPFANALGRSVRAKSAQDVSGTRRFDLKDNHCGSFREAGNFSQTPHFPSR